MATHTENRNRLQTFFDEEYQSLRLYVRSRIADVGDRDAEDIVQDVALKLFTRAESLSPIENVAGFVYNSVRNKIIDLMRSKKAKTYPEDEMESRFREFTELFYDTSDNTYSEQMKKDLKKAILNLKPDYKDVLIAVDFEGYTYREISEESGIPQGTLMSRRHRALSQLLKELKSKKI
ncbi:MAG: RNA polymerase sigma factor [Bacteroidota bacterium]